MLERALWATAHFNLVAGFLSAASMAALQARRRGVGRLLVQVPLMPAYWLLVSVAAYRAVWQLMTAPHRWEKTRHGVRRLVKAKAGAGYSR